MQLYYLIVYRLNLSWCNNIIDVSALGNVNILNFSYRGKITDISKIFCFAPYFRNPNYD